VLNLSWEATELRLFVLDPDGSLDAAPARKQTGEPRNLLRWTLTLPDGSERPLESAWPTWAELGYPTYTGWMTYRTELSWTSGSETALLDLGDVGYGASVLLDGVEVTRVPFRPYRAYLQGLTRGEHTLEVRVLNTPASQVCGTRAREVERFGPAPNQKVLPDRDKLRAGLFGPVQLIPMG